MDEIITCIIKIAAALLLLLGSFLAQKAKTYLREKIKQSESDRLDKFIAELTMAAEQMFKKEDEDGSLRLDYVQTMLIEAGYDLTEAVRAKIEACVLQINKGVDAQ